MPRTNITKDCEPLTVRFPQGMLDALRTTAREEDWTLNAQIVHVMRQWLKEQAREAARATVPA